MPLKHGVARALFFAVLFVFARTAAAADARPAPDFRLLDQYGRSRQLYGQRQAKAVVLYSFGIGCPISRKDWPELRRLRRSYEKRGVVWWFIDSMPQDTPDAVAKETQRLGIDVPVLSDRAQLAADALGLTRTCEALLIDTAGWRVVYRGAVDDRHDYGDSLPEATRAHLAEALEDLLAGREPRTARTEVRGCLFKPASPPVPDYSSEVAPIVMRRCAACHGEASAGPTFDSYERLRGWGPMIIETMTTGRMPPPGADPAYGRFRDEWKLTHEEARSLADWFASGAPRGAGPDPLASYVPPREEHSGLTFQVKLPSASVVGGNAYMWLPLGSPLSSDIHVRGIDIVGPGRRLIHHAVVEASSVTLVAPIQQCGSPAGYKSFQKFRSRNGMGIAAWADGLSRPAPEGIGSRAHRGQRLSIELHYDTALTTSSIDVQFHLAGEGARDMAHFFFPNGSFRIPPYARDFVVESATVTPRAWMLHGLNVHMHHRGTRMRVRARLPGQAWRTLLSVPWHRVEWQRYYWLDEPMLLPAGTELQSDGAFDNSSFNPLNRSPGSRVRVGMCTENEMFFPLLFVTEP